MPRLYLRVAQADNMQNPNAIAQALVSVANELVSQADQPVVAPLQEHHVEVSLLLHGVPESKIERFVQAAIRVSSGIAPTLTLSVVLNESERRRHAESHPDQALLFLGDEHFVHVRLEEENTVDAYCKILLSAL